MGPHLRRAGARERAAIIVAVSGTRPRRRLKLSKHLASIIVHLRMPVPQADRLRAGRASAVRSFGSFSPFLRFTARTCEYMRKTRQESVSKEATGASTEEADNCCSSVALVLK